MKKINFSTYHPIVQIDDNIVFANNGNIILCYRGHFPEIYSLSEKDFEDLHTSWFQALKTLPVGTVIHKQDIYRKEVYTAEKLPNNTFLERTTRAYFKGRKYISHTSYLFFIYPKNKGLNNPKYVNPFRNINKSIVTEMGIEASEFANHVQDTIRFLNNSRKLFFTKLAEDEILHLTSLFFNGFYNDASTDIELNTKNIHIGDAYFDILAVNNEKCFGDFVASSITDENFTSDTFTFHQGFVDGLGLRLKANHLVNQIIYLDDKSKWRKLLEKKKDELSKSANFGTQNKSILTKIETILQKINSDDNARIIRGHFNIIFWDTSQSHLKRIASAIKAEFKELDIEPHYPKAEERKHYYVNSYCCFSSNFSNEDLYVTDLKHALCLVLNNTNYKSDPSGIIFNDRQFNIPVLKDVWDAQKKRIKARNFAIFSPTGEGKSFLANNILRQYFESGVRLVIIDLGGSYQKFAKLYPDKHIILRYEKGKNLGINPFYIAPTTKGLAVDAERLEDIAIFLLELFASGKKATKAENVSLKKILKYYYQTVHKGHSLQSLYTFIDLQRKSLLSQLNINAGFFDLDHFLHILSEYVGDGIYSFLFETAADQSYKIEDKQLIVFELDEVKDNKEILSVMLKLIKSAVQRTIWQNKAEKGIILFDEFAKQLKFDNVLESVEFYYQAIRKQNGGIGIILQSINQLPDNATSASILENTQVIYSLNNEKGYRELQQRLNLSAHDYNQLKSIRNDLSGERKYTEIFIKIGKESNVFRLEVPKEAYAAYLTDGAENEALLALYHNTQNMEEAIKQFVSQ